MDMPEEPSEDDCCHNDCSLCVFDIYQKQLELWKRNCKSDRSIRYDLLSQTRFKPFELKQITPLTESCSLFLFHPASLDLEKADNASASQLPYKAAQHLILKLVSKVGNNLDGTITRAYTVVSNSNEQSGCFFQVLIKLYDDGIMSNYIKSWKLREITYWRGPYGDFTYEPNKYKNMLMICIGTGIAPMYAVVKEIIDNEKDETIVKLMYGCREPSKIILRKELNVLCSYWNFSYSCFLSKCFDIKDKKYGETFINGRISAEHIKSNVNVPLATLQILVCGTEDFCVQVKKILRTECSIPESNIYVF